MLEFLVGCMPNELQPPMTVQKKPLIFPVTLTNAEVQLPAVKKRPDYPGGKRAWQDFLRSNINIAIPFANKAQQGTYLVMIWFIVGNDGKIAGAGADSNSGYGMEGEVIGCILKGAGWMPAETTSGKKVRFKLRQQVSFKVSHNDIAVAFP